MKFCSRLFVLYCRNCPKDDKFRYFNPILRNLGAAWKDHVEFFLNVIELLFLPLAVEALYKAKVSKLAAFRRGSSIWLLAINVSIPNPTVGREMWITYNAVCIIIHQGLENVETFSSRPRLLFQDQDKDQDHFSCPRGASRPRPRSRDYISGYSNLIRVCQLLYTAPLETFQMQVFTSNPEWAFIASQIY